jgi:hypothetical protein
MRIFIATLVLLLSSIFSSQAIATETCAMTIKSGSPKVEWTAYKFTEKKAVKGEIKNAEFSAPEVATVDELISHLSFVINPMKVESGDPARDSNLRDFFFKLLKGTGTIRGHVISSDKKTLQVQIYMNGVTKVVPFKINQEDISSVIKKTKKNKKTVQSKEKSYRYVAEGEIDILDFRMQKSLESLNKVCQDLHKGADGVSKTWSQVDITVSGEISESCKTQE